MPSDSLRKRRVVRQQLPTDLAMTKHEVEELALRLCERKEPGEALPAVSHQPIRPSLQLAVAAKRRRPKHRQQLLAEFVDLEADGIRLDGAPVHAVHRAV